MWLNCTRHPLCKRIYMDMMFDSTVVCRRALGCEWEGKQRTYRICKLV